MVAADLGRAAVLAAVPAAALLDALRVELLYAVAFLMGALTVLFNAARASYLPTLVPSPQLTDANSKLSITSSIGLIAGPSLAGLLVQRITPPLAIAVDAVSFVVSAVCVGTIRADEPPPSATSRRGVAAEIGEGLRMLLRDPLLRSFVASSATLDVGWNALMAVYVLYLTRELGQPPTTVGLIFGIGSAGALLAGFVASGAAHRLGLGRALVVSQMGIGAGSLLIIAAVAAPTGAVALLAAAEFVQGFAGTVHAINRSALRQAIVPNRLRGRVGASTDVLGLAAATAGLLVGGQLGERLGLGPTMALGASTGLVAFLWLWWSPVRSLRDVPASASATAGVTR
jgi:MFS family permease